MDRKQLRMFYPFLFLGLLAGLALGFNNPGLAADQPNIVFIMFDDLGNADLGYRGSDIKSPHY